MSDPSRWPFARIIDRWLDAANDAINGILQAARTQRHVKFHLSTAFAVLFLSFTLGVDKYEFALLSLVTMLVIVAEMFNSALEAAVDLASREYRDLARMAKDIAAGAVLISAVGALVIAYLILGPHVADAWQGEYRLPRHSIGHIAVLAVVMIMLMVILIKARAGSPHTLRGGFPSGHTAVALSLWVSLLHLTDSPWLIGGGLLAAALVGASRARRGIHTWREVAFGGLLGVAVTWILFRLFHP